MDDYGFDQLTRAFSVSRRCADRRLIGGLVAGLGASATGFHATAGADKPLKPPKPPKPPKEKKPPRSEDPFFRANEPCQKGEACGEMAPRVDGLCIPIACRINDEPVPKGTVNPENLCEYCSPTGTNDRWQGWEIRPDGTVCGDPLNDPCVSDFSTCQSGTCEPIFLPDGHDCGEGLVCCLGSCCDAGVPCNSVTGCGGCEIDGESYTAGEIDGLGCRSCNAAVDATAWTTVPDDAACGESQDRVCCAGACCAPTECCNPAGYCDDCCHTEPGKRFSNTCDTGCTIDGIFYADGMTNPSSGCQTCDVSLSATSWTNGLDNLFCDPADPGHSGRCCNGTCCASGACCDADGLCKTELAFCGCGIGGVNYRVNEVNPANRCQACDPEVSSASWSPVCSDTCCAPLRCIHDGGSHCG